MEDSLGSVSVFFQLLQKGNDPTAAREIWQRYFPRLIGLANRVLRGRQCPLDAEDAVQVAFAEFFGNVRAGKVNQESRRDDIWNLLSMMTVQHVVKQMRAEKTQKRGEGKVMSASQFASRDGESTLRLEDAVAVLPTVEWDAFLSDLLEALNEDLREVAVLRLAGYTNPQIRDLMACSLRYIERRLQLIRVTWKDMVELQ